MKGLRALSVASELFPLIKTGGLGDVAGALPRALAPLGAEVRSLVPGYPAILEQIGSAQVLHEFTDLFGGAARLLGTAASDGLDVIVIDAPHLYRRAGNIYTAPDGTDWRTMPSASPPSVGLPPRSPRAAAGLATRPRACP
jgi:starch synthase